MAKKTLSDYEKQLEEENISLRNLLDERTKDLDDCKKVIEDLKQKSLGVLFKVEGYDASLVSHNTLATKSNICMDGVTLTAEDISNFKHLWSIHMSAVNNPPLLYKLWRKIVSCLTMKKN